MKAFFFVLFGLWILDTGCSSAKKANKTMVQQGITGRITKVTGNRMPMVGVTLPAPKGLLTMVYVYAPTAISQVTPPATTSLYTAIATKAVDSVRTDSSGYFTISLAPGSYSVFIRQGNAFYANLFDAKNNIALFTVEPGKLTRVNLTVSSGAFY